MKNIAVYLEIAEPVRVLLRVMAQYENADEGIIADLSGKITRGKLGVSQATHIWVERKLANLNGIEKIGRPKRKPVEPPKGFKYGIKAYGRWQWFNRKKDYLICLNEWIAGTEGAERDRAVDALNNLNAGINVTDTDAA